MKTYQPLPTSPLSADYMRPDLVAIFAYLNPRSRRSKSVDGVFSDDGQAQFNKMIAASRMQ